MLKIEKFLKLEKTVYFGPAPYFTTMIIYGLANLSFQTDYLDIALLINSLLPSIETWFLDELFVLSYTISLLYKSARGLC